MSDIPTAEAQERGLSGSDTFRMSHVVYLNAQHRDWGAVRLNIEALKAFTDTIEVSERAALAAHRTEVRAFIEKGGLAAGLAYPWSTAALDALEYINYEHLKIASGFELHLKARLLARDVVLHVLDAGAGPYRALAEAQRDRPIRTAEVLAVAGFHFDGKVNYLPGLTPSSLKLSWLTGKPAYRAALDLDDTALDVIEDYRELRNQIHLPGEIVETPALQALGRPAVDYLVPFINKEIVAWSNQLIASRAFTFRRLPELQ